jgi:hypothetical protein
MRRRFNRAFSNRCSNYTDDLMESACNDVSTTSNNCNDDNMDCECGFDDTDNVFPQNPMLGQSYVPWQTMNETFKPCVGLKMGTIFPELVSSYVPCQSIEEIEYIEQTNTIGKGCNK